MGVCSSTAGAAVAEMDGYDGKEGGIEHVESTVASSGRIRTGSEMDRLKRKSVLDQMRKENEKFTPENMKQFQFLIGMNVEDQGLWEDVFNSLDKEGKGWTNGEEVFRMKGMKEEGLNLPFVLKLFDQHAKEGCGGQISREMFFICLFNFLSLPRGDYMSRFIYQLYGGTEFGMTPRQFEVMCNELLGEGVIKECKGKEGGQENRMLKLIEHFINMYNLDSQDGGHRSHKSHKSSHKSHKTHKSHKSRRHSHSHSHKSHKSHKSHATNDGEREDDERESDGPRNDNGPLDTVGEEIGVNLLKLMEEKSEDPIIKFKFFVKAERKLRGEGIYHAAIESQNAFRNCIMGKVYWEKHIEALNDLVYSRDLWNFMDVFDFAICGVKMPENYHDLNYEDAEEIRARKKDKLAKRRASALANEKLNEKVVARRHNKKKRGEQNYQYMHYGVSATMNMAFVKGQGNERRGLGPGGLNPYLILSEMPDSMRVAFEKNDLTMLRQLEAGSDKRVTKEKFRIWIHKAEDAGLWESHHETGEGGHIGDHGSKFL